MTALPNPFAEMFAHAVGHQELCVFRPAVEPLGQLNFLFAERLAVSRIAVMFMRGTVANVAVDNDESWPVGGCVEGLKRPRQHFQVVGIGHAGYVPAVSYKPCRHIFAERPTRRAVERDVIVVVHPAKTRELQMSGERGGFAANTL